MKSTTMMKTILTILSLLIILPGQLIAKEHDHKLYVHVRNEVGALMQQDVRLTLMRADSTVLDTMTLRGGYSTSEHSLTVKTVGGYILRAESEGYRTLHHSFALRKDRESDLWIDLGRMQPQQRARELGEVVVRATKIKMVMRGDTIVYNADAFNLAEGSMLDALVSRLPGVRLTKDGQIYVNGRFVQSLFVNGRDFFSGNPQIALENLPAYTVSQVKVYDRKGALSQLTGEDMGDKTLTMDVRLKKEYGLGYLGNIETGIGTDHRYCARALGLRFTNKQRLMVFGNINNLNDNQRGAVGGDWTPADRPEGLLATKTAGLAYQRDLGHGTWLTSENIYSHTDADHEQQQDQQTFLPSNDSYRHLTAKDLSKATTLSSHNSLETQTMTLMLRSHLDADYAKTDGRGTTEQITTDSTSVLNHLLNQTARSGKTFKMDFAQEGYKFLHTDMLTWKVNASYDHAQTDHFDHRDISYATLPRDHRNHYRDDYRQQWRLGSEAIYAYSLGGSFIGLKYGYQYHYDRASNLLYRLDRLSYRDSTARFDLLPSTADALLTVLDRPNSYRYAEYQNDHTVGLNFDFQLKWKGSAHLRVLLPVHLSGNHLFYDRNGRHDVTRNKTFFEPTVTLEQGHEKLNWNLTATITSDVPDLVAMADYRDDSDPLNILLGNPNLKDSHTYKLSGNLAFHPGTYTLAITVDYQRRDNAMAYALTFNPATGVYTTQPVSVNGNWLTTVNITYTRPIDKARRWTLDNDFRSDYNHNVDLATVEGYNETQRSTVHNLLLHDNLRLTFRPNDRYEFSVRGGGNYSFIHGERDGFSDIHAGDYQAGLNATVALPWALSLSTDMTMYARSGYQTSEMNTTDWVWNAVLSRAFLHGRLVARLQGFDILHELSSTRYAVNAQGRTETWHNTLPRYAMFSLAWRFNKQPKQSGQ